MGVDPARGVKGEERPAPISEPVCPDCKSGLVLIDARPGKEAWACPVALEAQRRGLLGQPGRRHRVVWVWTRKTAVPIRRGLLKPNSECRSTSVPRR